MVQAADEIRKRASGMRETNLKFRKTIEESAKDQVGRGYRRIKRISQKVMQVVARKPLRADDVERVEKDRDSQGVNAFKDREEGRIAQLFSPNIHAEIDTAATKLGNRPLYLADNSLGIL